MVFIESCVTATPFSAFICCSAISYWEVSLVSAVGSKLGTRLIDENRRIASELDPRCKDVLRLEYSPSTFNRCYSDYSLYSDTSDSRLFNGDVSIQLDDSLAV